MDNKPTSGQNNPFSPNPAQPDATGGNQTPSPIGTPQPDIPISSSPQSNSAWPSASTQSTPTGLDSPTSSTPMPADYPNAVVPDFAQLDQKPNPSPSSDPTWPNNPIYPDTSSQGATQDASGTQTPAPNLSSLDNPWGAPAQPPPLDGPPQNPPPSNPVQPTWTPPQATTEAGTNPLGMPDQPSPDATTPQPDILSGGDSAPTDLSHLITNNTQETPQSPVSPETLVVPPAATASPEISVPTENHKGIPKWVIGLGLGLILAVAAASAYFILGIGQPNKPTTSLPATTNKNETNNSAPVVTGSQPTSQPNASGSANFGEVAGNPAPPPTPSATSAADLLRQRQGQ